MPSVVYWSGQPGGTAQYRCMTPGAALQRIGWDVAYYDDFLEVTKDGRVVGDPDVLVICRVMGELLADIVRTAQSHGTKVIYDTDDWFLGVPDYNPASKLPETEVAGMHAAMEVADLITVSTPGLAKLYAPYGETLVLPNLLDPYVWTKNEHYKMPHAGINIGWLAAYKWRGGDIETLREWLPAFLKKHPEVTFGALGCKEIFDDLDIEGFGLPMAPYAHLPQMLGTLDIGIVPLEYNVFNWKGKSACKSMEYNAMGIPSVASPSDANRAYIQPGVNGQLVRKNDWPQKLEAVMADLPAYRQRSREYAEQFYIDDHIWKWVNAYAKSRPGNHQRSWRAVPASVS